MKNNEWLVWLIALVAVVALVVAVISIIKLSSLSSIWNVVPNSKGDSISTDKNFRFHNLRGDSDVNNGEAYVCVGSDGLLFSNPNGCNFSES